MDETQTLPLTAKCQKRQVHDRGFRAVVLCERMSALPPREADGALVVLARFVRVVIAGRRSRARVKARHADDQSADPPSAGGAEVAQEGAGAAAEPAEARSLHARLHDDAEEAELSAAQGRKGASHEWLRGDRLHPGRGP